MIPCIIHVDMLSFAWLWFHHTSLLFCTSHMLLKRKTDLIEKLSKKERTKIIHDQLMTYFRERILDGRLSAGARLPTDEELAAMYQISRDTVRQALALLANEG